MPYFVVNSVSDLDAAVSECLEMGSASLTVPMFGGNSAPFDDLVASGVAARYRVLIELDLVPPFDVVLAFPSSASEGSL